MRIGVVIPAHNEEESVGPVIERCRAALKAEPFRIVLCDNDSTDSTARLAVAAGVEVASASPRGYGTACLTGIRHLGAWPDVLLFLDGDGSSRPEEMHRILDPIRTGAADLVVGVRSGTASMTPPQKWGTRLAAFLVSRRWGFPVRDLGPFRAIRRTSLERIGMKDRTWGWTVEMQILVFLHGLETCEVPVSWDKRIGGASKISGSVTGVIRAAARILWTIARYALHSAPPGSRKRPPSGHQENGRRQLRLRRSRRGQNSPRAKPVGQG